MEAGTATEQMAVNYETQCMHCLIAKTYRRYDLRQQGLKLYRVRSTSS